MVEICFLIICSFIRLFHLHFQISLSTTKIANLLKTNKKNDKKTPPANSRSNLASNHQINLIFLKVIIAVLHFLLAQCKE